MSCWNRDQEVCASCRYWSGKREVDFTGYHFNSHESTAPCLKPFGPFRGVNIGEGSSCQEWESFDDDNY
jgi:hypothetical protein